MGKQSINIIGFIVVLLIVFVLVPNLPVSDVFKAVIGVVLIISILTITKKISNKA
nr:hypothetical protein [Mammaliicoccus sp. Marseille-Q6498]